MSRNGELRMSLPLRVAKLGIFVSALSFAPFTFSSDVLGLTCTLSKNNGESFGATFKVDLDSNTAELEETGNIFSDPNFIASPTMITMIVRGAVKYQISSENLGK